MLLQHIKKIRLAFGWLAQCVTWRKHVLLHPPPSLVSVCDIMDDQIGAKFAEACLYKLKGRFYNLLSFDMITLL